MLGSTGPNRLLFRSDAFFSKQKDYFPLIGRKQASDDKKKKYLFGESPKPALTLPDQVGNLSSGKGLCFS